MPLAEIPLTELRFPLGGVQRAEAFGKQPARPAGTDANGRPLYVATCRHGKNVRAFEDITGRARGGSRCGIDKFIAGAVVADWIVQGLGSVFSMEASVDSLSGRFTTVVSVGQGIVKYARPGDLTWTTATNNTGVVPPLSFNGIVRMAPNAQKLFFADGVSRAYFSPVTNSVETWTPTAGSLPASGANRPRLIKTWRRRTVQAGLIGDETNWFMSRLGDPFNWDYAPASPSDVQAVAGNNAKQSQLGDPIQCIAPYSDDVLIMGGTMSMHQFRGDPCANGSIDLITDAVGMAWGDTYCMDPYGAMYFLGSRPQIYRMEPGQKPVFISQGIKRYLDQLDTGANSLTLCWDYERQCLRLFVTPIAEPAARDCFVWEHRLGAWWIDDFANTNHYPLVACQVEGNTANERQLIFGSWDGYVRMFKSGMTTDDGSKILSEVTIGPILTNGLDDVLFNEIQGVLAEASADVEYEVRVGKTAEAALDADPVVTGTWHKGRNFTRPVGRTAHALYVTLRSEDAWAMEYIRAATQPSGMVRRRHR